MFIQITNNFLLAIYLIQSVSLNNTEEHGWVLYTDNTEPGKVSRRKISKEDYLRITKHLVRIPSTVTEIQTQEN